jgi:hypothetical protein
VRLKEKKYKNLLLLKLKLLAQPVAVVGKVILSTAVIVQQAYAIKQ